MQLEGGLLMEQVGYIVFLRTQTRGREGEKKRFVISGEGEGRRKEERLSTASVAHGSGTTGCHRVAVAKTH